MALKFVNKSKTKLKNFLREVSVTNSLSSSPFIIKVFDVVFETEDCYVFAQEFAPAGDLFDIIPPQVLHWGLSEGPQSQAADLTSESLLSTYCMSVTVWGLRTHSLQGQGPALGLWGTQTFGNKPRDRLR